MCIRDRLKQLFLQRTTWAAEQGRAADAQSIQPLPDEVWEELRPRIAHAFRTARRGRAPGLDGGRAEHWRALAGDAGALDAIGAAVRDWMEG
eukprot:8768232-Alexandrium_andersonii.AAC.1